MIYHVLMDLLENPGAVAGTPVSTGGSMMKAWQFRRVQVPGLALRILGSGFRI